MEDLEDIHMAFLITLIHGAATSGKPPSIIREEYPDFVDLALEMAEDFQEITLTRYKH
mgnify:CR=1 FL=1|tara:strand:+ start:28438 stop:28611 length:174 start_codon:yes stop_codon:yes gene_type:complete